MRAQLLHGSLGPSMPGWYRRAQGRQNEREPVAAAAQNNQGELSCSETN